ncbi:Apulose-4-phosphate transketolase subunit A [Gammaproteobacteria bacterium]
MIDADTLSLALKIRKHVVEMAHLGKSSHVASALSMADIVAVLYGEILNIDPKTPKWVDRDRFILSKGHAGSGIYAALAETGFFDVDVLKTHYQDGSILSGHVSHKGIPGVELSTGSLGHGLSVGTGMAYAAKLDDKHHKIYVLMSDGECDEGSNWEAILFAAHHKLDRLVAIIDYNKIQSIATTKETLDLEPFADKWQAFGWHVQEVDGHNHREIKQAVSNFSEEKNKPHCIIAHTTKGKGISFMENTVLWHYRSPQGEEYKKAMRELEQQE